MPNSLADLSKLSVVIPAFQENPLILDAIAASLETLGAEVLIVDDGSKEPYPKAIKHGTNFGYGSALMTGIKNATRPIVCTMDGDGQHRVEDVVNLFWVFNALDVDMVVGVRRLDYESPHRFWGRKFLNTIASLLAFKWLPDLNSGMRIFKKHIVEGYFPILCKEFSFTTSLTMSMMCDRYKVEFFPIKVEQRKYGKSHVKVVKDGLVTLYYIIRIGFALRTRSIRAVWRKIKNFPYSQ